VHAGVGLHRLFFTLDCHLGKMYVASIRMAFALACVGACLILGAHWLGFLPDPTIEKIRARKSLSEAIAVNAAAHVRKQQWVDLTSTLKTHVDRNPDLLSIGIRSDYGVLRADTGHHAEIWPDDAATESTVSLSNAIEGLPEDSTVFNIQTVQVPITLNRREWGRVELCYHKPNLSLFAQLMHHPLMRLLAFFMLFGMLSYTLFVIRVLGLFNKTQVVPDRVRQALDTLAEGLLILDEQGKIVLANQAFGQIAALPVEDLVDHRAADLGWIKEDVEGEIFPWAVAITTNEVQAERLLRYQLASGEQRIFSVNAAPLGKDRAQRGALATFRDVTHVEEHRAELERMLGLLRNSRDEIKRKNVELEILATQDALTGCLNRRAFFETFESMWNEATLLDSPLSCLMIDIDHFKSVNDTYGHHTGDEVLRQVAQVIRTIHGTNGLVCRYGGEEFCVVFPQMELKDAIAEGERTRLAIMEIRLLEPAELRLTASIGVSNIRFEAANTQELINQADMCLYIAKREGRNRVISYNPSLAVIEESTQSKPAPKRAPINIPYQTVSALVSALSYRDANTAEHSRRVADLCARAAVGLLDPAQTYVLEIAALLHDIGKIGVPDQVLLKPGPLTSDEWELMGRHDRIGDEIIASAFDCPELSAIISCHHAFYGGAGRNRGLPAGKKIPVGARLLTIADSYDAMVSDRVYRKARSHQEAVAELRRCANDQFDPDLVEHFIERITTRTPLLASGAMAIQKQTTIQIGQQVERLADAVANHDIAALQKLSAQLGTIARSCEIESIAKAAEKIEAEANSEDLQWLTLLSETHDLLDICRHTQSEYLKIALESESIRVNSLPIR
jgi:diguanylate cyclase (GGDEF)-like protein/PAS domain S-box-containing protein